MGRRYAVLRSKAISGVSHFATKKIDSGVTPNINSTNIEFADLDDEDARNIKRRDEDVQAVIPVMPFRLHQPTERPQNHESGESGLWGLQAIGALACPFTGSGITVAVLDTGINAEHEAFQGLSIMQRDFTGEGLNDMDGHGTHCAGTIFGRTVQGLRIGVAPGISRGVVAKVIGRNGATTESLVKAIEWSVDNGAHIISMSIGIDFPGLVKQLLEEGFPADLSTSKALEAYRANLRLFDSIAAWVRNPVGMRPGALLVAAAGNESRRTVDPRHVITVAPPAASDNIISVGALECFPGRMEVASFSNGAPDVSAPGVGILSAHNYGGLTKMSGTSMAAPHATGVAALWAEKLLRTTRRYVVETLAHKLVGTCSFQGKGHRVLPLDTGAGIVQAPLS